MTFVKTELEPIPGQPGLYREKGDPGIVDNMRLWLRGCRNSDDFAVAFWSHRDRVPFRFKFARGRTSVEVFAGMRRQSEALARGLSRAKRLPSARS